ncbi:MULTISPECIES: ShlB/FhaC/HecB family hemolysin secretion/activation protein [unclassified Anabaena]|uniref:ShlB/FhaC/HecB family hemolysin secretion/activation protein n=1 Tax=unclassified Anabaena TaxID=2619674 RepID=UPI00144815BE|nr:MULTISPECIES: ShlB/FhaC/HecB family hemolysin secretion/activation protein [unclassified Anabaena]MTJ07465.1 ShlB/FhaC/HecB family hemolysin secretion/activation protein [Anabaena sp. UHCC 0204]MTJ52534.1 ShlB/FhaC/HecB family hemolysin secretion/activation protein [Anabaena sp. UHCC 0253]
MTYGVKILFGVTVVSLLTLWGKPAKTAVIDYIAQLPNPIIPTTPELTPVNPQQSPLSPLDTNPPTLQPGEISPQIPGTIRVEGFEFQGNTAFSDRQLTEVTKPFTDREITFAELIAVETAIAQKYIEAGYINSGAVISANQTFPKVGGVVKIQIIEGELTEIQIIGNRRLNSNYVRSRLEIATKKPLNRNRLLAALQILQLNPLIANISAELQPGTRPQQSRLQVRVKEADTFSSEIFTDNNRSPSVGSLRRGIKINQSNLLGLGDGLNLSYTNSDGSNAFDGSYTLPINARNGTIEFTADLTNTNIIEQPFNRLDITGKSRTYQLTYRQPVVQKPNQELALGLTFSRQKSQTSLLNERFPLSPGANNQGETSISAFRFFQEYVQRNPRQVFAARSQFSLGTDIFNATVNNNAPDSRFFAWRGQGQYVRLLAPETLLILRSDIQLSTDSLLSLEQIGIGGAKSVRGYRQDLILTDNSAIASAEIRLPILRLPEINSIFQIAPFIDFGVGWNHTGEKANSQSNSLLGTGLGIIWQMSDTLNARLDYGIPLIDVKANNQSLQDQGFYFTINYFLF